jgi:diketogulonate reductase-like aldo/keto reductase
MAEDARRREEAIAALLIGLDPGMTVIDTAEMYADGAAEELVGEAIAGRREDMFLVSKVLPENATRRVTIAACERSLRRLATEQIDLSLLHWRGQIPLEDTLDHAEKIRAFGVSNFNVSDLEDLLDLPGSADVATDQVLYNLHAARHRI